MGYFEFEDKVKKWIENHRASWYTILIVLGMGIGIFGTYLLGASLSQGLTMGSIYSIILTFVEYYTGGSG